MRLLALDATLGCCSVALLENGAILTERTQEGAHGQAQTLPLLVNDVLAADRRIDAIGVTTGPGSFTGLRASISLAQGLAAGANARLIGVTVAEAIRQAHNNQPCWIAVKASRDRIFLDRGDGFQLFEQTALPCDISAAPIVLAGDGAEISAAFYGAMSENVTVLGDYQPLARSVAYFAAEKLDQVDTIFTSVMPLYGDAPDVKRSELRPPPTIAGQN
jgi:tRNA threonylcarbamoyladenosine biosynthesis protein TsaB